MCIRDRDAIGRGVVEVHGAPVGRPGGAVAHRDAAFAPGAGAVAVEAVQHAGGRLWICHWGGRCVSCHDPASGAELTRIELPAAHITDCAFGGPDLRTLYITSAWSGLDAAQRDAQPLAGALFAVELDSPGLPAPLFGG